MSKIVFFCIPAHGHTNPTLGVVRELVRRGHQVWYYSYDEFRTVIEDAGARFISCNEFDQELKLSPEEASRIGDDLAISTRVLVDTTLALDETVCRHMEELQPDCIVGDSMAIWARAAALKLHIPFVSSTTTFAFNRESAKVMKQGMGGLFKLLCAMGKVKKEIRRLRDRGYPVNSVLDLIQNKNDVDTVVYTSPEFQPCADTFSAHYAFVGPSVRPVETPFEKKRDKLVYISMGTVRNDMESLYRSCIEAFRDAPWQVVLSVGRTVELSRFADLPDNVEVYDRVDQMAVLEKADVFLSHCGMNSASESLWFGVPLVLFPQTAEQEGVANRIEALGAGLRLKKADRDSVRAAVEAVLTEPDYRAGAGKIAESFRACPGAAGAADKILSVCRG